MKLYAGYAARIPKTPLVAVIPIDTMFFDFDVISLTFRNDSGEDKVIPAIANPLNSTAQDTIIDSDYDEIISGDDNLNVGGSNNSSGGDNSTTTNGLMEKVEAIGRIFLYTVLMGAALYLLYALVLYAYGVFKLKTTPVKRRRKKK